MDIVPVSYQEFRSFFPIFIRVSVILFMFPFFSARVIPVLPKVGLTLIISIILFPVIGNKMVAFPDTLWGMVQLIIAEFLIGMILGLLVQVLFEAVRIMGQLVGFQTGFAIVNILDPQSGSQVSILANMAYLVAITFFLILNGHHILLSAMRESFEIINPGSLGLNQQIFQKIMQVSGDMFVIALRIGAPAIAALLFTSVAFGLVAKLIPQMNVMIVLFPIKIVIGLFFFGISLHGLLRFMERCLGGLDSLLINTMSWLRL